MASVWALIFIALLIYCLWWVIRYNGPLRIMPGIFPVWPIVGNLPQLNLRSSTATVEELAEQFNYKPFELWFGPQHVIVVSEPDVVKRILQKRPVTFKRSAHVTSILNSTWGAPGVFTAEKNDWARQRRLTAPLFNKLNSSSMVTPVVMAAMSVLKLWKDKIDAGEGRKATIEVNGHCDNFTLNVILSVAFGVERPWAENDEESLPGLSSLREDIQLVMSNLSWRIFSPYAYWNYLPRWMLPKWDRDFYDGNLRVMSHIKDMIAKYEELMSSKSDAIPDNLLSRMMLAAETDTKIPGECPMKMSQNSRLKLSEKEVISNINLFMFAGTDTTSNTLGWAVWYLATNPLVQNNARQKIYDYLSKEKLHKKSAAEIMERIALSAESVPILDAIVKETLRLRSPAPAMVFDSTGDDLKLDGIDIKLWKDMHVFCLLRLVGTSKKLLGQDAREWNPERWLPGVSDPELVKLMEEHFLAFGFGPRICVGKDLAALEARTFLFLLLMSFQIKPAAGFSKVDETFGLTLKPKNFSVNIQPADHPIAHDILTKLQHVEC